MTFRRVLSRSVLSLWLMPFLCGGCTERGDEARKGRAPQPLQKEEREGLKPREPDELTLLMGEVDSTNRFPSVVMVIGDIKNSRGQSTQCSGVLVSPRVVLTSGHCVCKQRTPDAPERPGTILIDGSECVPRARIRVAIYDPPPPGAEQSLSVRTYAGKVRPHPEFKLLLDPQGRVSSSKADLAAIHLDIPIGQEIEPISLAEDEVKASESLIAVGYGSDEALGLVSDQRHWMRHTMIQVGEAGDERWLFDQPTRHLYRGDSGGPFLREAQEGFVLVGISARSLDNVLGMTSTYPYRAWVHAEMQHAAQSNATAPH